jgi:uncharacterized protein (DUF1501 family)
LAKYAPEGTRQGEAALLALARHPVTANHIATKFSRHFVVDEPPPGARWAPALDGPSAVAPVGDPDYLALHSSLALLLDGDHPALPLDSFFSLNPAMPVLKRLYG